MTVKNLNCNRSKWKGLPQVPIHKRGLIVKQKLFFLQRILTAETGTEKRRRKRRSGGRTSAKCTRTSVTVVERVENSSCATDPGVPRLTTWSASTSSNLLMVSTVCPKAYYLECLRLIKPPNGEYSVSQGFYHLECLNLIKPPNGEYSVSQGLPPGVSRPHQTS